MSKVRAPPSFLFCPWACFQFPFQHFSFCNATIPLFFTETDISMSVQIDFKIPTYLSFQNKYSVNVCDHSLLTLAKGLTSIDWKQCLVKAQSRQGNAGRTLSIEEDSIQPTVLPITIAALFPRDNITFFNKPIYCRMNAIIVHSLHRNGAHIGTVRPNNEFIGRELLLISRYNSYLECYENTVELIFAG